MILARTNNSLSALDLDGIGPNEFINTPKPSFSLYSITVSGVFGFGGNSSMNSGSTIGSGSARGVGFYMFSLR
jgi:hypothetical protein